MAATQNLLSFYTIILITFTISSKSFVVPPDGELLLQKIKPSLQGNTENLLLSSWSASVPLCQWRGLKWVFADGISLFCFDPSSPQWTDLFLFKDPSLHLVSLQLPSANLSGTLPGQLGQLSKLQSLNLSANALFGNIPLELGYSSSLSDIDLSSNKLTGQLPTSVWNLCDKLFSLRLHGNALTGSIPEPALRYATCKKLKILDLGKNMFSGYFPEFTTKFEGLKELDLSDNKLSGQIPRILSVLNLKKLNLSHNNFSGFLPKIGDFGAEMFEGNSPALCGLPLEPCRSSVAAAILGLSMGFTTVAVLSVSIMMDYFEKKKRRMKKRKSTRKARTRRGKMAVVVVSTNRKIR